MSAAAELRAWRARRLERPLPVVDVDHGPWIPGWLLRVLLVVATAALVLGAVDRVPPGAGVLVQGAGVVAVLWVLLRPGRAAVTLALCLAAVSFLASPAAPFDPAVWWTVPLAYATLRCAWWTEQVHAGTRVELAALGRAGGRDVVVLGAGLLLGVLGWALAGLASAVGVVLGVAALVVLAALLLRR